MPRRTQTPVRTREPSGGRGAASGLRWLVWALAVLASGSAAGQHVADSRSVTLAAHVCCRPSHSHAYVIWTHGEGKEVNRLVDTLVEDLESTLTYNFLATSLSSISVVLRFNESIYTSKEMKYETGPRVQEQVLDGNTSLQRPSTTTRSDARGCVVPSTMQKENEVYSSTCGGSRRLFEVTFINGNHSKCWQVLAKDSSSGRGLCSMGVRLHLRYNTPSLQPTTDKVIALPCSNAEENCFNLTLPHASVQISEVRVFKMMDGSEPPHGHAWIIFVVVLVLLGGVLGFVLRQKWRRRTQDPIVGERWSPPRRSGGRASDWSPPLRRVSPLSSCRSSTTPFFEWDLHDVLRRDASSPERSPRQLQAMDEEDEEEHDTREIFTIPLRSSAASGQRVSAGAGRSPSIPPPLPPRRNASRVSPPPPLPPRPLTPRRRPVPAPKKHAFSSP